MAREKLKIAVRWYNAGTIKVDGVTIGVLKPLKTVESVEVGDPIDVMLKVAEDNARQKKGEYLEIIVEGSELREIMGESPRYKSTRLLFPIPSRLRRVGIVKFRLLKESREGGYFTFSAGDVEWHDINEEVYVYEGKLEAPSDVLFIVLDTDRGLRIVKTQRVSMQKLSSQPPPQQAGVYGRGEDGLGGENSPS